MKTLEYSVEKDEIKKSSSVNYSELVPGSGETINLKFIFSKDWDNTVKVVEFVTRDGVECEPQIVINNMCSIPEQALKEHIFHIRVLGKSINNLLTTKKLTICQSGGRR